MSATEEVERTTEEAEPTTEDAHVRSNTTKEGRISRLVRALWPSRSNE